MNYYEHTIIARQDASPSDLKKIQDKYLQIVEKLKGKVIKSENWGLLNLAYLIKKNKKGNYIHFKIEGDGKLISELENGDTTKFWQITLNDIALMFVLKILSCFIAK